MTNGKVEVLLVVSGQKYRSIAYQHVCPLRKVTWRGKMGEVNWTE
jgi:hypothetical protein